MNLSWIPKENWYELVNLVYIVLFFGGAQQRGEVQGCSLVLLRGLGTGILCLYFG